MLLGKTFGFFLPLNSSTQQGAVFVYRVPSRSRIKWRILTVPSIITYHSLSSLGIPRPQAKIGMLLPRLWLSPLASSLLQSGGFPQISTWMGPWRHGNEIREGLCTRRSSWCFNASAPRFPLSLQPDKFGRGVISCHIAKKICVASHTALPGYADHELLQLSSFQLQKGILWEILLLVSSENLAESPWIILDSGIS